MSLRRKVLHPVFPSAGKQRRWRDYSCRRERRGGCGGGEVVMWRGRRGGSQHHSTAAQVESRVRPGSGRQILDHIAKPKG